MKFGRLIVTWEPYSTWGYSHIRLALNDMKLLGIGRLTIGWTKSLIRFEKE